MIYNADKNRFLTDLGFHELIIIRFVLWQEVIDLEDTDHPEEVLEDIRRAHP